jgi:IS5 family transposase
VLEGIEVIMFRTIGDGPSEWESRVPAEVLRLPDELARVDALLADPVFFAPFAPHFHPVLGRPSTPAECYLRLMFLKFRHGLGFETLCAEVSDSISWRRFCRIPLDSSVPDPTTLMKLTSRCGEAGGGRAERGAMGQGGRAEAAAHRPGAGRYHGDQRECGLPTDSGLLAKAVGKLVRTARRVQAAGGATATMMTDRRRAAGRRVRQIASTLRSRSKLSREESSRAIRRVTGELAGLAETTVAQAAAVVRNGRRAVPKALSGRVRGRLRRALAELVVTIGRTATIVAQARTRIAAAPAGGDPAGQPARPRRPADPQGPHRPPGRARVQVTGNDDGVILDYAVELGAVPRRPAAGPGRRPHPPPDRAGAGRGHRRPRLRPGRRRE